MGAFLSGTKPCRERSRRTVGAATASLVAVADATAIMQVVIVVVDAGGGDGSASCATLSPFDAIYTSASDIGDGGCAA